MSRGWMRKGAQLLTLLGLAMAGLCASAQGLTSLAPAPVKIAMLLPLRSPTLGTAAEAVRTGILAGHEQDPAGANLTLLETDGSVEELLAAYAKAVANYDLVIGPLARSEVATLISRATISKPTIALSTADMADGEARLPANMLRMGLSLEDEARQVAAWIAAGSEGEKKKPSVSAWAISTPTPWQKRAAAAFAAEWRARKMPMQVIEIPVNDGALDAMRLAALRKKLRAEVPAVLFVALDAGQAAQVRTAFGADTAMYGTSQLNFTARVSRDSPLPNDSTATETRVALDGVLLLDIPWQVNPDLPAVRLYPQLLGQSDPPPTADQARLYALGIDAYRVARELLARRTRFDLDGVTGSLRVRFEPGAAHFDRLTDAAVYRAGAVVPVQAR